MCCVFLKNKGVETVSPEQEMVSKNVDLQKNPTEVQKWAKYEYIWHYNQLTNWIIAQIQMKIKYVIGNSTSESIIRMQHIQKGVKLWKIR